MESAFIQVLGISVAVAVAPGPDFFMVLRNSLSRGRLVGVMTALGIGSALIIHVCYSVLGLALIIASSPTIFGVIRVGGALYLLSIALRSLLGAQGKNNTTCSEPVQEQGAVPRSALSGWREGFYCNLLNPKSALFFLSIFSQFMTPETPELVRWIYGAEVIAAHIVWFVLLALFLSTAAIQAAYTGFSRWIDAGVGLIFGGVGCSILFQEARKLL
ncbi:LysE family translocator [Desulfovibrionales bacterium]